MKENIKWINRYLRSFQYLFKISPNRRGLAADEKLLNDVKAYVNEKGDREEFFTKVMKLKTIMDSDLGWICFQKLFTA